MTGWDFWWYHFPYCHSILISFCLFNLNEKDERMATRGNRCILAATTDINCCHSLPIAFSPALKYQGGTRWDDCVSFIFHFIQPIWSLFPKLFAWYGMGDEDDSANTINNSSSKYWYDLTINNSFCYYCYSSCCFSTSIFYALTWPELATSM